MHKFAEKASMAALAASKQDKYLAFSKMLLKDYKKLNDAIIKKHAETAGLDMEKFNKDMNSVSFKQMVKQDMQLGSSVGVRGVPAIYINGRQASGRSLQAFSQTIEQELKKK